MLINERKNLVIALKKFISLDDVARSFAKTPCPIVLTRTRRECARPALCAARSALCAALPALCAACADIRKGHIRCALHCSLRHATFEKGDASLLPTILPAGLDPTQCCEEYCHVVFRAQIDVDVVSWRIGFQPACPMVGL